MRFPKVILIGGPPFVGKSSVARSIAAKYQYGCISTDDIGKAVGAVTSAQTHPGLHYMDDIDYQEYFAVTPVDIQIAHARRSHKVLWPALEKIIRAHSAWGDPLVLEGYALWPDLVIPASFPDTGSIWLASDDQVLETRIRSQKSFYRGAANAEALITSVLRRSSLYNQLMVEAAEKYGGKVLWVSLAQSIEDMNELCVSILAGAA